MCILLKVELKEGDITLEPNVWQGRSNIVSELEEDIEDLQEKVNKDLICLCTYVVIMYVCA